MRQRRSQALLTTRKVVNVLAITLPWFTFKGERVQGIKISYSRASSYLSCPQKHHFSYVEGLKAKRIARPLRFGSDFHKLLQFRTSAKKLADVWSEIEQTYDELSPKMKSEIGDAYLEDLNAVFSDYLSVWADREVPVETEHEFLIKLGTVDGVDVYFHGIIDELYENGDIGEHKTFNTAPDMSILAMNMQTVLYAKARQLETGQIPEKVRWDYIKSTPAKYPVWLEKSKRFSEAANSQVTHLSWLRACEERGIEDENVLDTAFLYEPNISNFFFRATTDIVPQMVKTAWRGFKSVCKDIALRGNTHNVKNISRDCSWCDYRPICYAEFTGADVAYVKKIDFEVRERN